MTASEFDEAQFFAVLVARSVPTIDGIVVAFDDICPRRSGVEIAAGITISLSARRPTPEALTRALAIANRSLSPTEFSARLSIPLSEAKVEETRELVRWFNSRCPTPLERLAYIRRAYARRARTSAAAVAAAAEEPQGARRAPECAEAPGEPI